MRARKTVRSAASDSAASLGALSRSAGRKVYGMATDGGYPRWANVRRERTMQRQAWGILGCAEVSRRLSA